MHSELREHLLEQEATLRTLRASNEELKERSEREKRDQLRRNEESLNSLKAAHEEHIAKVRAHADERIRDAKGDMQTDTDAKYARLERRLEDEKDRVAQLESRLVEEGTSHAEAVEEVRASAERRIAAAEAKEHRNSDAVRTALEQNTSVLAMVEAQASAARSILLPELEKAEEYAQQMEALAAKAVRELENARRKGGMPASSGPPPPRLGGVASSCSSSGPSGSMHAGTLMVDVGSSDGSSSRPAPISPRTAHRLAAPAASAVPTPPSSPRLAADESEFGEASSRRTSSSSSASAAGGDGEGSEDLAAAREELKTQKATIQRMRDKGASVQRKLEEKEKEVEKLTEQLQASILSNLEHTKAMMPKANAPSARTPMSAQRRPSGAGLLGSITGRRPSNAGNT